MPDVATRTKGGPRIRACNCKQADASKDFYCITPNCNAVMRLINVGNPAEAYFRRKPSSPHHISARCSRCAIVFDESEFDEKKFNPNTAFAYIFKQPYNKYNQNLSGNLIVECSYYKKVYNEPSLLFNYPCEFRTTHDIIRINFQDNKQCWNYFNKLKSSHHTEPIAIAGNWIPTPDMDYQAECTIYSTRQIYIVK